MDYHQMRLFKQELGREECERVIRVCTYGVLALCGYGSIEILACHDTEVKPHTIEL